VQALSVLAGGVEGHARKCEVAGVTVGSLGCLSADKQGKGPVRKKTTAAKSGHTVAAFLLWTRVCAHC
jgi:hypothetical protein